MTYNLKPFIFYWIISPHNRDFFYSHSRNKHYTMSHYFLAVALAAFHLAHEI